MSKWNPTIRANVFEGAVESMYLLFGETKPAAETAQFFRTPDGAKLLIDMDENNMPIGMQFVKQIPLSSISTVNTGDDGQDLDTIVSDLYAFANQMIAYHLAHQEAMQNIVLRKALERSKDLAPYSQKNKAA